MNTPRISGAAMVMLFVLAGCSTASSASPTPVASASPLPTAIAVASETAPLVPASSATELTSPAPTGAIVGYTLVEPPVSVPGFVATDAYTYVSTDTWTGVWVGTTSTRPNEGHAVVARAPLKDGVPDASRQKVRELDLGLAGAPFMIMGTLDSGLLAIINGDGSGGRVGIDLDSSGMIDTLVVQPVHPAPVTMSCGPLAGADCRELQAALIDAPAANQTDVRATVSVAGCADRCPSPLAVGTPISVVLTGSTTASQSVTCSRKAADAPIACD